jgi:hypothetical protein
MASIAAEESVRESGYRIVLQIFFGAPFSGISDFFGLVAIVGMPDRVPSSISPPCRAVAYPNHGTWFRLSRFD